MKEDVLNRETNFHDEWANSVEPSSVKVHALEKACTMPETRFILKQLDKLGGIAGKKILEIGCGCGEASAYFAIKGGDVTATDLSPGMVGLAKKVADYNGVSIKGNACSADELPFEDNYFDMVYAANVLHHVDMEPVLNEIKRVLKTDGLLLCWDPILYNPAINIYRRLASDVRTIDEHPVDSKYLKLIKSKFSIVINRGFWLNTCLIFVKYYFIDKINPGKERYWKKVVDDAEKLEPLYNKLEKIDNVLLKIFPFLKWMCWNMVVIAKKG